ncbi:MAG: VTT domain-containing protein [Candidatus Aenigmarchaeota archaeon]|nr:VTT domain-containing protein [Candidatus Aenigmarchaeota archaeon]
MLETFIKFLLKSFGYLGIFFISLISASTVFLPTPLYLVIFLSSIYGMNPVLIAFFSGLGMTFGELTSYFIGLGGSKLLEKKHKKSIKKFENFFKKYGFLAISITAFLPFPFDIVGISAGIGKYEVKKFLIATFIGKFFKAFLLALIGFRLKWLPSYWSY